MLQTSARAESVLSFTLILGSLVDVFSATETRSVPGRDTLPWAAPLHRAAYVSSCFGNVEYGPTIGHGGFCSLFFWKLAPRYCTRVKPGIEGASLTKLGIYHHIGLWVLMCAIISLPLNCVWRVSLDHGDA